MATEQSTQVFIRSDRTNIVQYVVPQQGIDTVTHNIVRIFPGLNVIDSASHKSVASQMANTVGIGVIKPIGELPEREALDIVKSTTSRESLEIAAKSEKRATVSKAIAHQISEVSKRVEKAE